MIFRCSRCEKRISHLNLINTFWKQHIPTGKQLQKQEEYLVSDRFLKREFHVRGNKHPNNLYWQNQVTGEE
jgi:hypothetical protein